MDSAFATEAVSSLQAQHHGHDVTANSEGLKLRSSAQNVTSPGDGRDELQPSAREIAQQHGQSQQRIFELVCGPGPIAVSTCL